jgi:phage shock protein E
MKIAIIIVLVMLIASACSKAGDAEVKAIGEAKLLIDVRTAGEFNGGHLDGALLIPYDEIADKIGEHAKKKTDKIVLYCRSGHRAGIAKKTLAKMGYTDVINAGSYQALKAGLAKQAKLEASAEGK